MPTFLDLHRDWAHSATWLPDEIIEVSGLMCLSTIVARKLYVANSTKMFFPNMYVLYLADSGAGKEIAINNLCYDIVHDVQPEYIVPMPGSPEALIKLLLKKDRGCGTLFQEEFSRLLSDKKYMSDMVDVLTDLYNSDKPFDKFLASWEEPLRINDSYFSLFVGTQPDRLQHMFKSVDITGGFIPRITTFGWKAVPFQRRISDAAKRRRVVDNLRRLHRKMEDFLGAEEVNITEDAIKAISDRVTEFRNSIEDEKLRMCYARPYDPVFKLALLYWVNDLSWEEGNGGTSSRSSGNNVNTENTRNTLSSTTSTTSTNSQYPRGIYTPDFVNYPRTVNFVNLWDVGVDIRHVERALMMYRLTLPWTQLLSDASACDTEDRNLIRLYHVVRNMRDRGELVEIPDGNGTILKCVRHSDVLKSSHMAARSFQAYMNTLIQHDNLIGHPVVRPGATGKKGVTYYPVKSEEEENGQ